MITPADGCTEAQGQKPAWRQTTRWLVLDVTGGLDAAKIISGPMSRAAALSEELSARVKQREEQAK